MNCDHGVEPLTMRLICLRPAQQLTWLLNQLLFRSG